MISVSRVMPAKFHPKPVLGGALLVSAYLCVLLACIFLLSLLEIRQSTGTDFDDLVVKQEWRRYNAAEIPAALAAAADYRRELVKFACQDAMPPGRDQASRQAVPNTRPAADVIAGAQAEVGSGPSVPQPVPALAFPAKCDPTIAGDGVVSIVAGNTIARALRQQLDFMTWHTQYINGLAEKRPQLVALLPLSDVPVLRTVIDAPYEIQLSLLVVLMGCLGGMISVIRCYVDASLPDPSVGEFFYRPAIGALVALGIYVLFKAGQLMLGASTPGSGGEAGTGAFLAAFLGIISGLSARDAIGAIDAAASRMWQRGNFVYVYKIADDKISDAERGGLLKLLGIDGDTWKVWLAGRTPIPRATAQRVADYLRLDMRDIFTAELV